MYGIRYSPERTESTITAVCVFTVLHRIFHSIYCILDVNVQRRLWILLFAVTVVALARALIAAHAGLQSTSLAIQINYKLPFILAATRIRVSMMWIGLSIDQHSISNSARLKGINQSTARWCTSRTLALAASFARKSWKSFV